MSRIPQRNYPLPFKKPVQFKDSLKQKLKEDRLYKQIGHLKVEVDFLKDSCDQLGVTLPEDGLR